MTTCIRTLRKSVSCLKTFPSPVGRESRFASLIINDVLPNTNFKFIGEEFVVPKGKTDIWLANCDKQFLLSLELKVGKIGHKKKQQKLKQQVNRYTNTMRDFFPEHQVFGLGAFLVYPDTRVIYYPYNSHNYKVDEIEYLKEEIDYLVRYNNLD